MTDQPQKWIFVAPETFGDWTCGEWSTEGDGALLHSDVQVLYALAKDMIPRAEADAMVAAAFKKAADLHDWTFTDKRANRAYWQSDQIRALTPADARAAFEQAVQEAVEAEKERIAAKALEIAVQIEVQSALGMTTRAIADVIEAAIRAPQETSE